MAITGETLGSNSISSFIFYKTNGTQQEMAPGCVVLTHDVVSVDASGRPNILKPISTGTGGGAGGGTGGDASAANQMIGNNSLSSIDTKLTGIASASNQNTTNTILSNIDTKITTTNSSLSSIATNTNISKNTGVVDANTTRVTLATDGPVVTGIGNIADSAATTDTGSFSIISFLKRGLQNWTNLLARIPTLVSGKIPVIGDVVIQTTPTEYTGNVGTTNVIVINSSDPTRKAITIQNTHPTQNLYYKFGSAATTASHVILPFGNARSSNTVLMGTLNLLGSGANTTYVVTEEKS